MLLRLATSAISLALHAAVTLFFVLPYGGSALEAGTGDDTLVVEQGIALEGIARSGDAIETVEEVEAPPVITEAQPEIKEVKPPEEEKDTVIASKDGPEQEQLPEEKPEEVQEQRPPQVATEEQREVAVEEQRAAGAAQTGGSTTDQTIYLGKLRSHLEKNKVNPRSRVVGTVIVRFTVNPDGSLVSREVATSSGSKMLDDAAMASIDRAAPFPPRAEGASGPVVVSVPFKFSVR